MLFLIITQELKLIHMIFCLQKKYRLYIIKSIFNKGHSHYYYNIFVEKCSYQLAQK